MKKSRSTLLIFQSVKTDYQKQINQLTLLKSRLNSTPLTSHDQVKARLRMQVETFLIDINEEMFALSDELAKAFINS